MRTTDARADVREGLHEDRLLDRAGRRLDGHDPPDRDARGVDAAVRSEGELVLLHLELRRHEVETKQTAARASIRNTGSTTLLEPHRDAGVRVGEQQHGRALARRLDDPTDETVAGHDRHPDCDARVGSPINGDRRLEVPGRARDHLRIHARQVPDERQLGQLAQLRVLPEHAPRLRRLAPRLGELAPQCPVLVLQVAALDHAVEPVRHRGQNVVDRGLHRRHRVARRVAHRARRLLHRCPGRRW